MKFAFISTMEGWHWGGSEELWSQTASALRSEGHEIKASIAHSPGRAEKVNVLVQQGIEVESRPAHPPGRLRKLARKMTGRGPDPFERLRRFHPDLAIISQGYNGGGFDWAKTCIEAGIPYVTIVHCNCEFWWFGNLDMEDAIASYRNARKVYCVSHGNLDLLRFQLGEPLPNAEVVWNPYAVSTDCATDWPDESKLWRMACVARMDPGAKGQDLLLRIFSQPEWRARPIEVNLFGTGPYEKNIARMVETLDLSSVKLRGHVSDIEAVWKENHMLLLPSRYEGLPLALVEAMWCGRPAVATDVGGNAELCVDGQTGFIASVPSVASFGQTLERAWKQRHEWRGMGQAARARAEALVPKNPIVLFIQQLKSCAESKSAEHSVSKSLLRAAE